MTNTPSAETLQNGKKLHIEVMRVAACFFVIFNHTGDNGYFLFSIFPPESVQYWLYGFVSVFCKFSVPLFFAISGALLLPKEEGFKKVYSKRVLRMAIILVVISVFYYCFNNGFNFTAMTCGAFLSELYGSTLDYHLWYLYAFISFLIALPLLRPMAINFKNVHFLYMAACSLFFSGVLPVAEYFLWKGNRTLNGNLRMEWITSSVVIYPLIGYYIENRMDVRRARKKLIYLWLVNIVTIAITCVATYYRARVTQVCDEYSSQVFYNSFVLINMITVYITAKCLCCPAETRVAKAIRLVGSCTFGIYLGHVAVLKILLRHGVLDFLRKDMGINYMAACLIFCLIIMCIGFVLTWIAKKIPLLNKLL
ncbi:MAG: acyltransferase family protein [Oscillospiraceae bacterium]|nr:acyltransferase family protein [Oscillospiraceae bacterium]